MNELCTVNFNCHQEIYEEKKEEIWLSPVTKAPTPTENSKMINNLAS